MKFIICLVCSLLCLFVVNAQSSSKIQVFYASLDSTSANPVKEYFNKMDTIKGKRVEIEVLPHFTFQTLEGIGGAFNEIGGEALLSLDEKQQIELMKNLFASENAGFSFCRTAIGASDFGLDAYGYSEVANDYEMKNFSVARDQKFVIPYIKQALNANPALKIFASPWSPPAWMKKNGQMIGVDYEGSRLKEEVKVYQAYAKYFSKYIQDYKSNGINIGRICVQNETDITTNYPNCIMPPEQLLDLANQYIRPEFKKEKVNAEIYAGTFRIAGDLQMHKYLLLKKANTLDGIGVQYTDSKQLLDVQVKYPGYKFMHTEGKCFNGKNSVEQAQSRLEEISGYINANCTNYCYWNIILNETTESGWKWKQNSLINIDRSTKKIQYNPDYNVMCLVSKYLKPGDVRIASTGGSKAIISVIDKQGRIKLIMQNELDKVGACTIKLNGEKLKFILPPRAIAAVIINKN